MKAQKDKIWREIANLYEAQIVALNESQTIWFLNDRIYELQFISDPAKNVKPKKAA